MAQQVYLILFICSLLYLLIYMKTYVKQHGIHYIVFGILATFTTLGYWMFAMAGSTELALRAQQIVYVAMMFIPIVIIRMATNLCKVKKTAFTTVLMVCSGLLVLSVVTTEATGLFYKSYELDAATGHASKEYGLCHTIYYIYLLVSLAYAGYILFANRKKPDLSITSYLIVFCSGAILLISVLAEKLVPLDFNFDALGVVVIEAVLLVLCRRLPLYDVETVVTETVDNNKMIGIIIIDDDLRLLGYNEYVSEVLPEIDSWHVDQRLPESFLYYRQVKGMISSFEKAGEVLEVTFEFGGKYYLNKVTRLRMNGRECGYQVLLFDNTESVKYQKLLQNFNDELQEEVERQTELRSRTENAMVLGMAEMVEGRDSSTGGHIKRTSAIVRILTHDLMKSGDLDATSKLYEDLVKAAPLHDLGKITVDDAILRKPDRFTPEEYEEMKQHAAKGGDIVSRVLEDIEDSEFLELSKNVATYHHERWDGKGYPTQLAGEDIPLEARIMAVADVYDALVSKRHYKEGYDFQRAYDIIMDGMGTQFDPKLRDCFERCAPQLEAYYSQLPE